MFPKSTMQGGVAMPEKPPLQKESAVVYMVDGDQADVNNNRWLITRAKICACTVVITTLILVAGTLGAITLVLQSQQGTIEATHSPREPLLGNNSPLDEPIVVDNKNPGIRFDNGGLAPPKIPVTPDLVAVDGQGTVALSSSPKPVTDGINIDSEGDTIFEPIVVSSSSSSSDGESIPYSQRSYVGRTYVSSSFPYDGWYMRGEEGHPPSSYGEESFPDPSEASGDMDSDLEGSAESEDIPSDSDASLSDPHVVSTDGQGTVALSSSSKPVTDGINIDSEGGTIFEPVVSSSSSSSDGESIPYSQRSDPYARTYISSSFPYDGWYMRGEEGHPPSSYGEESFPDPSEASGDMDSDLEGSAESEDSSSSYSDPYVVSE